MRDTEERQVSDKAPSTDERQVRDTEQPGANDQQRGGRSGEPAQRVSGEPTQVSDTEHRGAND